MPTSETPLPPDGTASGGGAARRPPRAFLSGLDRRQLAHVAVLLVAVVVGYHYTLSTLLTGLALDSPLAYLGLVPPLSATLVVVLLRRPHDDHDIHDRQVDLFVGAPLLALGLAVLLALPDRLGSAFWLWRVDVLSLPLFVAGAVCLLFGVRVLWRLRLPIAFLAVAWPLPWATSLGLAETGLLAATTGAVRGVLTVLPDVARGTGPAVDGVFEVLHPGDAFTVVVASTCAGASSTVGFLLFGSAAMLVATGSPRRRLAWLLAGTVLAWTANVLRIVALLAAGRHWGEDVAIDGLHPVLGSLLFALTCAAMALLLPRFGLSLQAPRASRSRPTRPVGAAGAGRGHRAALAGVLAVATVTAGAANQALAANDRILGPLGHPRLPAFAASPAQLAGWAVADAGSYEQAARYFGGGATWQRLLYQGTGADAQTHRAALPVSVDVIGTASRRALSAFGVEACYAFHRFDVLHQDTVGLGGGVRGQLFTYLNRRDGRHWNTLVWEWPVHAAAGTRYERVVMMLVDVPGVPVPRLDGGVVGASVTASLPQRLAAEREFLLAFARRAVSGHVDSAPVRTA